MKYLITLLISFILLGCAPSPAPINNASHNDNLTKLLFNLNEKIDKKEAEKLAATSLKYSLQLIKEYDLVTPPLYQNFLVNIGVKERGLCWQFAYDMLSHTLAQNFTSFDYYIGGAHINDYWEEHNTLVVTCKGCKFSEGIILDPWRNSGTLFFSKVGNDIDYNWTQRGGLRN